MLDLKELRLSMVRLIIGKTVPNSNNFNIKGFLLGNDFTFRDVVFEDIVI